MTDAMEDLLIKSYLKGSFKAVVEDIRDPKKMRRIRAKCPSISENTALPWATPKDGNRDEWLPKKGDLVWIEFEGWDIDFPVWSGFCPAKDDVSGDFKNNYGHDYRLDRDYNGNRIEWTTAGFKATDKNNNIIETNTEGIHVTDKNNNTAVMDSSGIKLEDKSGNKLETTSSGIKITDCNNNTFEMKSGKISVNGTNLEVEQ